MTPAARVDHLVVGAASLAQGAAWCEATLGVVPVPGGRHALMGTHNRLLRIAGEGYPDAYLEIIAIAPDAPPPARARWFGLDDPALQAQLAQEPQLLHLVARTEELDALRQGLDALQLQPGEPVAASRDTPQGLLAWRILLRADGSLGCGGALPTLIEWQGRHPAAQMAASGIALQALVLRGVPDVARDLLQLPGVQVQATGSPALQATLATPRGPITLQSCA